MRHSIIKKLSPFNNRTDMPAALLVVKKLLAFILCYAAGMAAGNAVIIGIMAACGKDLTQGETFSDSVMEMLGLYGIAGMLIASIIYWKLIEKRKLSEMGVNGRIGGWFIGALIGIGLLLVCVAAIALTGSIRFEGLFRSADVTVLLLMFGGYAVQGATEEFLCRGLVLGSLRDRVPLPAAVAASTAAFIVPHLGMLSASESKYILSGLLNLVVISCVFCFLTLRTNSIWAACGLHSVWNFVLSCILGLNISGGDGTETALINMRTVGENLLNGGSYGIEASIVSGIIIAALAAVTGYMVIKTKGRETVNGVQ